MTGAPSHSSRGRTVSRGKKKLPPIPERSLSSQNVRGGVSGGGGVAVSKNGSCGPKMSARVDSGGCDIVPPTLESRIRKKTQSTPPIQVAAFESRDDEDSPSPASPLSTVAEKEKKSSGVVKQVEEPVISPLVSPSSPTAATGPEVAEAGTTFAKDETKASEQAEVASVASNSPWSNTAPVDPPASHVSPMISEEVSVASVKSSASKLSGKVSVASVSVKSSVPKDNARRSSGFVESKTRNFIEEAAPTQPTVKSIAPSIVESSSETNSPRSVKSNSKNKPSTRSAKDKVPDLGKLADGASKQQMTSVGKLSDAPTPNTSNLSRKRIVAVVGEACDDRHDQTDGQAEVGATKRYTAEPSWEDYQRARMSEANTKEDPCPNYISDGDPYPEIRSIPTDEVMNSFMKKPGDKPKSKHDECYFFDDNPNASDEEKMDISRGVRDQYQLGRLQARIARRGQSGFESSLACQPSPCTRDTPSSRKTVRSSRIKTVRNLYTHPVQNVQQLQLPVPTTSTQEHHQKEPPQDKHQGQPQDKHQEQQKKLQTVPSHRQEPTVPLSSGGSIHGSTHGSVDNAKSHSSIANNTSSTIPSLQPGQSINHSLTSSTMHSTGMQSAFRQSGGHSALSPVSPHSGANCRVRSPVSRNSGARSPVSHHSSAQSPASQLSGTRSVISAAVQSTLQSISNNSGTAHQISISSPELSEYRGKLFAKMLHMLHDLSPTKDTLQEDDVSNIKDMVIDESRASCTSIAELKLIQKLTEEEMSRILHEFEQNNSLVERRSTTYGSAPEIKTSKGSRDKTNGECERPPAANKAQQRGKDDRRPRDNLRRLAAEDNESKDGSTSFPMPEKIVYHEEVMTSIASKFSDVTSPTCHDGFELDEIMPGLAHRTPMMLPPLPRSATSFNSSNHKKSMPSSASSLPPTLSPAAAAAAATAASMSLSGRDHPPPQYLPSLLEIPDTIGLNEENKDAAEGGPNGGGKKGTGGISSADDHRDDDARSPFDLVEAAADNERETSEFPRAALLRDRTTDEDHTLSAKQPTGSDDDKIDEGYIKIKASEVLAASREKAILADSRRLAALHARERDHHDSILSAAAKAGGGFNFRSQRGVSGQFDAELSEVASILSRYEEAKEGAGEDDDANKESAASKGTSSTPSTGDLGGDVPLLDNMNDLVANPKNVTFAPLPILDPLPEVDNKPLCGICLIQ